MRRAMALVLVMALVVVARESGGDGSERFATMALGFLLIVAALVGEAGERIHLPRLTGYLGVGLAFGPAVLNLVTPAMTSQLKLINGLAVALIAFSAGMELDLPKLRSEWKPLLRHGGWLIGVVFFGLFAVALGASPWLPVTQASSWPERTAIALVLAATLATFSPTVVMAVLAETRARGPLSDRVLQIVVLGDLAIVLIFTLTTTAARMLTGSGISVGAVVAHVVWEVVGSLLIGAAVGAGIYLYRRFVDRRSGLVVAAACLLLAEVGTRVGLSPLLLCLTAGVLVRNAAPAAAHDMERLIARVRMPVLVVFFAAVGASLHLDHLIHAFASVALFVVARAFFIRIGNQMGARAAGLPEPVAGNVFNGLVSQAGVTLGLAVIVGREFGAWGQGIETLVVGIVSMHELIGPVLFRNALARMGEIPPPGSVDAIEPTPSPHAPPANAA